MKRAMIIVLMIIMPLVSFSQTDGPNFPLTSGNQPLAFCVPCSGSIWYNTNFIIGTDGQYSSVQLAPSSFCFQDSCFRSRYLTGSNFNFSIPSSAIILGIEVNINGSSDVANAIKDQEISLAKGNVLIGSNMALSAFWSITDSIRCYGNAGSLWGVSVAPADINDSNFGIYIKIYNASTQTPSVFIDEVSMTITYSLGTEILSATLSPNPVFVRTNYLTGNFDVLFQMPQGINSANCYVYDINGKECFSSELKSTPGTNTELHINTESLSSGAYFINISTKDKLYVAKTSLTK